MVVLVHSLTEHPFNFGASASSLLDQSTRWAVPFFYIGSGFFLARQETAGRARFTAPLARLAPIFLVWSLLYTALSRDGFQHFFEPVVLYRWVTTGGAAWHLWFLPSLAVCLVANLAMQRAGLGLRSMLAIAAGIYIVGLALGSYHFWLIGQVTDQSLLAARLPILDGRGGPFPLIFVVIGYAIAKAEIRLSLWASLVLCVTGGVSHIAEGLYLDRHGWSPLANNDMLIGTIAFGTGAFLLAERLPPSRRVRDFANLGKFSLGVYVLHVLVLIAFRKLFHPEGLLPDLALMVAVFAMSLGLVLTMARVRPLRALLT